MTEIEAAWLAGLFEGEGCITAMKKANHSSGNQRFLVMKMTDEDVVRKAHLIAGVGKVYGPYRAVNSKVRDTSHYKPFWQWSVFARDEVLLVGNAILPHLGERRRAKMLEALDAVSKLADARKPKEKQNGP